MLSEFEELTGESLFTIGEKMQKAKNIRAFLFACMKSAKEEITLDEVGDLIDIDNFAYINERMNLLMEVSYGKTENDSDDKKK